MENVTFEQSGRHLVRREARPGVPDLRRLFAAHERLTTNEIRERLGLHYRTEVSPLLNQLVRRGEIVREGKGFCRAMGFRYDLLP